MTSIYEVAAQAGVSITTVSHVFSGNRHVASETVDRVLGVAAALNYSPRLTAKGLATGRSMILGISFPSEREVLRHNPYFPELLEGLSAAAAKTGYGFLLVPNNLKKNLEPGRGSLLSRLDGVIVSDPIDADQNLRMFLEREMPIVTIGRCLHNENIIWVDNDHRDGILRLFEHMDEQGYERPALISKRPVGSYERDVEQSFRDQARARELPARIVRARHYMGQESYELAYRMLEPADRPDFIIASTDSLALAVLRAANDLGISVPEELGVAGEGDTILATTSTPPITSIRVYPQRLGDAAVGLLLRVLDGKEIMREQLLPVELVTRSSTKRRR